MKKYKYKTGLIIGRFQPFHKGHEYLIKQALQIVDSLIIGIGSSNLRNSDNPYGYRERKKMIEIFARHEGISHQITKIIPIPDFFDEKTGQYSPVSDQRWLSFTLSKVGRLDVVIGNNEWVNGIFSNTGYKIIRVPYFKRYIYEGEKIRKLIRNGSRWEDRVPKYLITIISG